MTDSEEENVAERPAKIQKRFTFQRFSQRVAQVRKPAMTLGSETIYIFMFTALHVLEIASRPELLI